MGLQSFLSITERISAVFQKEELTCDREIIVPPTEVSIKINNASFGWGFKIAEGAQNQNIKTSAQIKIEEVSEPYIVDINFDLKYNDLLVVVGETGVGKTTLLYAIMQENVVKKGTCQTNGTIAYVEQEPFIIQGSVKENILFGKVYKESLFFDCLKYSQLIFDIKELPNGYDTIIGARGCSISGGQKARISLARALYSEADIYLLDDPLSAVDPQVANNIFT